MDLRRAVVERGSRVATPRLGGGGGKRYATLVVGTLTSGHSAAEVDYLCDGVDDQVEINAALAAIPATGGTVLLLAGEYWISDTVVVGMDWSNLVGETAWATWIIARGISTAFANGFVEVQVGSCRVADLTISNHGENLATGNVGINNIWGSGTVIERCNVMVDALGVGIYATGGTSRISGCYLESVAGVGISVGGAHAKVDSCHFRAMDTGISAAANYSTISNCIFESCQYGVYLNADHIAVSGCSMYFSNVAGIHGASGADRCAVTGNAIRGNNALASYGVYMSGGQYNTITGNSIGQVGNAISIQSAFSGVISANAIEGTRGHAILLTTNATGWAITGNMIDKPGLQTDLTYDGIHLTSNCDKNSIQGNVIRRATGVGPDTRYGIRINTSDCEANIVTNNDLSLSGTSGSFSDAGTGTITAAGNRL